MAIVQTQQYRPITNAELASGDALSTRAAIDMGRTINNRIAYTEAPIVIPNQMWNGGYLLGTGSTPAYAAKWAPIWVPGQYTTLRIDVHAEITAGTSTNLVFHVDQVPYVGAGIFSPTDRTASITITGGPNNYNTTLTGIEWLNTTRKRWLHVVMFRDNLGSTDNCIVRVLHICTLPPI